MGVPSATNAASQTTAVELVKGLRLLDATTIVMGSMIGSGIFIVAADVARQVRSPGLFMLAWLISGLMTVAAAITYGELAAMMPKAGGQYVYLREAFGPLFGFLYGWTLFLVIQTGTHAAVGVAFGKFLGVFVPWVSAGNILVNLGSLHVFGRVIGLTLSSQQLVAILAIAFPSVVNIFGLRTGAWVQNVFHFSKGGGFVGSHRFRAVVGKPSFRGVPSGCPGRVRDRVGAGDPHYRFRSAGGPAFLVRCVEQRDLYGSGGH